ncbi:DHS-like NAD FAD-binding protein [Rhizoctonia solani]|uniref:DHS-like NAD FAD-binding protein n=1 Tax=Rhizoctonia solani TaxID=456999 RepID=A0A8H7M269_9AGAM|nr:DHS-like NAD FAD-binding protein [Rhizoctonia solani]
MDKIVHSQDFRSSDGLYNLVKERYPDVVMKGRDLFDAALFRDPGSAAVFYTFMAELKTQIDSAHPAPVHDFLAMLDDKGKLLRSYTQNIDGLEERAGLGTQDLNTTSTTGSAGQRAKNVQLHGDIHRVRCTLCSASYPCSQDHIASFREGVPPDCPECIARSDARTARAARALKCGTLRPAIVLYDEPHPLGDHIGAVQTNDLGKKPDLLIVMGTSLKVHGLRLLVKSFAKAVHSSRPSPSTNSTTSYPYLYNVLFVNRTPPPPGEWTSIIDYHIQGDTDTWMRLEEVVAGQGGKAKDGKGKAKGEKAKDGKAAKDKSVKGKDANATNAKTGKSKSKPPNSGSENQPPPSEIPKPSTRLTITLPKRKGLHAGIGKSPLHGRGVGRSKAKLRIGLGTPGRGLGTPARGTPVRQASLATPIRPGDIATPPPNPAHTFTPMRPAQKRPAPICSPFIHGSSATPLTGQFRIDAMFSRSPVPKRVAISSLSQGRPGASAPDPTLGTPTPGRVYGARIVKSPVQPTIGRSPGFMEGVEGPGVSASTSTSASASESGIETTESEMGALASASESDAGMDTTDADDMPTQSLVGSVANAEVWNRGDFAMPSPVETNENESVGQDEEDEAEKEDDGDEAGEEAEKTIRLSQPADNVDLEDSAMHSPEDILETTVRILPSGATSKPASRTSTSTQASHTSSQVSRHSTQDSIFSAQGSQDTPASSQEEDPVFRSSQTVICAPGSSQTITRSSTSCAPTSSLDLSQTITLSPPPSRPPSPEAIPSRRYLGNVRPAPFTRAKTIGDGKTLFKKSNLTRFTGVSNWSAQHAPSGARRPGHRIPIPGKDFTITTNGKRVALTSSSAATTDIEADSGLDEDSSSEEDVPLASCPDRQSPKSENYSCLAQVLLPGTTNLGNGIGLGLTGSENARTILLFFKGKEKESDREMVIDVDPTTDEEAGLDGRSSSGPDQGAVAASPIQTRARRRLKEVAAAAAAPKRNKRAPRAGTRTSSRLAAMTSTL